MVITGAFGALGRVVAAAAAEAGWRVVAIDRADRPPEGYPADAETLGGVDLTDAEAARLAMAEARRRTGRLDALVSLAGGFVYETLEEGGSETWTRYFTLNLATAVNAAKAALPYLIEGGAGRIVNVGAASALHASAGMGPYAASKSAVHRFTESLAAEVKLKHVTVNAVLPSIIDTPANRASMPKADPSRWVSPRELAAVILFLASPEASAVTGALLPVAGRV